MCWHKLIFHGKQAIEGFYKPLLYGIFIQVRRRAPLFAFEFVIALPDRTTVFAGGVPDLGAVERAAITADQLGTENAAAAVLSSHCFSPGDLQLHRVPFIRLNDCLVAVFYIVLWNLALIDFHGLGQKIRGE